jgi:hypothetical protein
MSWRDRKQDIYVNHGKTTTTTLTPSTSSEFYRVTQWQQHMGAQSVCTFEGVFPRNVAVEQFTDLVAATHAENVEPPGYGQVLPGVIDEGDTP